MCTLQKLWRIPATRSVVRASRRITQDSSLVCMAYLLLSCLHLQAWAVFGCDSLRRDPGSYRAPKLHASSLHASAARRVTPPRVVMSFALPAPNVARPTTTCRGGHASRVPQLSRGGSRFGGDTRALTWRPSVAVKPSVSRDVKVREITPSSAPRTSIALSRCHGAVVSRRLRCGMAKGLFRSRRVEIQWLSHSRAPVLWVCLPCGLIRLCYRFSSIPFCSTARPYRASSHRRIVLSCACRRWVGRWTPRMSGG